MGRLMINWEEKKVFCNTCKRWVHHDEVWIDGHHDFYLPNTQVERSAHTVWEK